MRNQPPNGVPLRVTHEEKIYEYDCMAGDGSAVYVRKGKEGQRTHVILCKPTEGKA